MIRVTKANPCSLCGRGDWCSTSDDGAIAVCMRVQSSLPTKSGGGWVHILKDRQQTRQPLPPPPTRLRKFDAEKYHERIRADWDHVWADGTALSLGVSIEALERLRPGYDSFAKAVGFPMRDADGKVIGIRLRNFEARKWAVAGSQDGLFFDPAMTLGEDRELVICEGPTDTAAALTIGLCACGRSACMTGTELLKSYCKRMVAKLVTIIADNDDFKECQGQLRRPGLDGAVALGRSLGRFYRIITTQKKDLRQWVNSGLTREAFMRFADVATKKMS